MHWLFSSPSIDDVIRLLKAWRFWSVGALVGALIGAAVYFLAPPPYRAHATVVVDFNLEQAWPKDTDRQQFYYLERETRKLKEVAWSDAVIETVAETQGNVTTQELRSGKLSLSQPADGGWHFYVDDRDPERAAALASRWAQVFVDQVHLQVGAADGLNSFIEATQTQAAQPPRDRSVSLSTYLFVSAVAFLAISSFFILFFSGIPASREALAEQPFAAQGEGEIPK